MLKLRYRNQISNKMMLMMAFLILSLATAMMLINFDNTTQLQNELHTAIKAQNQYFQQTIRSDFERIQKRMLEITSCEPLLRLTYQSSFLSAREIQYNAQWLMREMELLRDISDLVQSVQIISVNGENHPIMTEYPLLFHSDPYTLSQLTELDTQPKAVATIDGDYHLTTKYPSYRALKDADFVLDLSLSNEAVSTMLNHVYMGRNGMLILTDTHKTWHIENSAWGSENKITPDDALAFQAESEPDGRLIHVQDEDFFYYQEVLDEYGLILIALYPANTMAETLHEQQKWYWLILIMSAAVLFAIQFFLRKQIHKPLEKLVKAFQAIEQNQLNVRLTDNGKNEFSYLYRSFNTTIDSLQNSIRQNYEHKIAAQNAELKQLQLQINPHFLYNSLFVIYNMAQLEDYDSIKQMTQYLGDYYRFVYRSQEDHIPLAEDYDHALTYLQIQSMRLGTKLTLDAEDPPADWRSLLIPRLTFQPIVENIFKHSFDASGGNIHISFLADGSQLIAAFQDDGKGMPEDRLRELNQMLQHDHFRHSSVQSGLFNVHYRLHLSLGASSGLRLSHSEYGGLCVEVIFHR